MALSMALVTIALRSLALFPCERLRTECFGDRSLAIGAFAGTRVGVIC
jgi:hypothetical protein